MPGAFDDIDEKFNATPKSPKSAFADIDQRFGATAEQAPSRGLGGFFLDTAKDLAAGSNLLVRHGLELGRNIEAGIEQALPVVGGIRQLLTGNSDAIRGAYDARAQVLDAAGQQLTSGAATWQDQQSEALKAKRAARAAQLPVYDPATGLSADRIFYTLQNPSLLTSDTMQSVPEMGAIIATTGAGAQAKLGQMIAAGVPAPIARQIVMREAAAANIGASGVASGVSAGAQARDDVLDMPAIAAEQRSAVAQDAAGKAFAVATPLAMLAARLGAAGEAQLATRQLDQRLLPMVATQTLDEGLQGGSEQLGTNAGMKYSGADPGRDMTKDVLDNAAMEALAGGTMGAGMWGAGKLSIQNDSGTPAAPVTPAQASTLAETVRQAAAQAGQGAQPAQPQAQPAPELAQPTAEETYVQDRAAALQERKGALEQIEAGRKAAIEQARATIADPEQLRAAEAQINQQAEAGRQAAQQAFTQRDAAARAVLEQAMRDVAQQAAPAPVQAPPVAPAQQAPASPAMAPQNQPPAAPQQPAATEIPGTTPAAPPAPGNPSAAQVQNEPQNIRETMPAMQDQATAMQPDAQQMPAPAPRMPPPRARVDPAKDSLAIAAAKLGGFSRDEAGARGIDMADNRQKGGLHHLISRKGRSFDAMAEALAELGYPVRDRAGNPDPNVLEERLRDALAGNDSYTPEGDYARVEAEYGDQGDRGTWPPAAEDDLPGFDGQPAAAPQQAESMDPPFRAGPSRPGALTVQQVEQAWREHTGDWRNPPRVRVINTIPGHPTAKGYYLNGEVVIAAGAHTSRADLITTIEHESIGHYALRLRGKEAMNRALTAVLRLERNGDATAKAWGATVDRLQPGLEPAARAEEMLARAVETGEYQKIPALVRLLKDLVAALRDILTQAKSPAAAWSDAMLLQDIFRGLREGRRLVEQGSQKTSAPVQATDGARFSKGKADQGLTREDNWKLGRREVDPVRREYNALVRQIDEHVQSGEYSAAEGEQMLAQIDRVYQGKRDGRDRQFTTLSAFRAFLSAFPQAARYADSRLLGRVRAASDAAADQLGGQAEKSRVVDLPLGHASAYRVNAEIVEGDSLRPDGHLRIEIYTKEQLEAGLTKDPALEITISKTGELVINGPDPQGETFQEFKKRGWADYARDGDGNVTPTWTRLTNPNDPAKPLPIDQVIPLLADAHARMTFWRGEDRVGIHWTRATGGTGGTFGEMFGDTGGRAAAVFFRKGEDEPAPLWFSPLKRAVEALKQPSAPAAQWLATIRKQPGVKPDELEWTGLADWLAMKSGKVTKDELVQFLEQNGVQVQEVMKGEGGAGSLPDGWKVEQNEDGAWEVMDESGDVMAEGDTREEAIDNARDEDYSAPDDTKYSQWVLPGGQDYRELLLTLPARGAVQYTIANVESLPEDDPQASQPDLFWYFKVPDNVLQIPKSRFPSITDARDYVIREKQPAPPADQNYQSSHWNEPNILAHIRFNERTDADGKRVLFIEELQSDWAQEGKKKGFGQHREATAAERAEWRELDGIPWKERTGAQNARLEHLDALLAGFGDKVPTAPFITKTDAWVALAIKRMIRYAAENGFDRVAFVNGEQSADRYDLSKRIEKITVRVNSDDTFDLHFTATSGAVPSQHNKTAADLPDIVGKDLAETIVERTKKAAYDQPTEFSGVDLKVGGAGMRAFYDRIVPTVAKDVLKKLGGPQLRQVSMDIAGSKNGNSAGFRPEEMEGRPVEVTQNQMSGDYTLVMDGTDITWGAYRTEEQAQTALEKLQRAWDGQKGAQQLGFDITDDLRDRAMSGMPLFRKGAPGSQNRPGRKANLGFGTDAAGDRVWKPGEAAYEKLAAGARKLLGEKVREKWGAGLAMANTSPAAFRQLMREYVKEWNQAQAGATAIGKDAAPLSEAERILLSDVLENELAAGVLPPSEIEAIAVAMRHALNQQTDELVRLGMLSQESADRWRDSYLPRLYKRAANDDLARESFAIASRMKVKGDHLKGRGIFKQVDPDKQAHYEKLGWEKRADGEDGPVMWRDFTKEEREKMGENRDAVERFLRGFLHTQRDIAVARLLERVSLDPELASKDRVEGWPLVPADEVGSTGGVKKYGKLAGMYVHPEVWEHLKYQIEDRNELERLYRHALSAWKEGKTVLNPVAHTNNVISNTLLVTAAGANAADIARGLRSYFSKDAYFKEATDLGLLGNEYYGTEIQAILGEDAKGDMRPMNLASRWLRAASEKFWRNKAFEGLRKAYDIEDAMFKIVLFRRAREGGMTPEQAVDYAEAFVFNYSDLPPGVKKLRDYALPFVSYTYKAVPAMARLALTRPHRMAAIVGAIYGFNALAFMALGPDADEDEERKVMPEYYKGFALWGVPKLVRLPVNLDEQATYLDIYRWVPLGDFVDTGNDGAGADLPSWMTPGGPLWDTYNVVFNNRDSFTGRDFFAATDTNGQAFAKILHWQAAQWVPMYYHGKKILDAARNEVGDSPMGQALDALGFTGMSRRGDPAQMVPAAAGAVGVKVRTFDTDEERRKRLQAVGSEVRELRQAMRREQRDKSLPDDRRRELARQRLEQIRKLSTKADQFRKEGEPAEE